MVNKKIVCIGGGTGTSVALTGLKKYPVELTAIVSMADDGGANKVIRDEFGLLPTSDIRQCFVALAEDDDKIGQTLRQLFTYRFHKGKGLNGMTFGNIFMLALTDIFGSQTEAIKKTSEVLRIKGKILPTTLTDSRLVAIYENGKKVVGEHFIDMPESAVNNKIEKVYLEPKSEAYPDSVKAIMEADVVVIGPGDLYTSLISGLAVDGIAKALQKTSAKIVYVLNLMDRYGQTSGFSAKDHIKTLEKYIDKCIDFVLVNSSSILAELLKKYEMYHELPVKDDLENSYFKTIRQDMLSNKEAKKIAGDVIKRSLIRHDPDKLAKVIMEKV